MPISDTCGHCGVTVSGRYVVALQKKWHREHFVCSTCGVQILKNFYEDDGKLFCQDHFLEQCCTKCFACKLPIIDDSLEYGEDEFHEECFVCAECDCSVEEWARIHEGRLLCQKHYAIACGEQCHGCQDVIIGPAVKLLDKRWHKDCVKCHWCGNPVGDRCLQVQDQLCCVNCKGKATASVEAQPPPPAAPPKAQPQPEAPAVSEPTPTPASTPAVVRRFSEEFPVPDMPLPTPPGQTPEVAPKDGTKPRPRGLGSRIARDARTVIAEQTGETVALQAEVAALQKDKEVSHSTIDSLRKEMEALRSQHEEATAGLRAQLTKDRQAFAQKESQYEKQLAQASSSAEVDSQLAAALADKAKAQSEVIAAEAEVADERAKRLHAEGLLETTRAKLVTTEERVERLEQQLASVSTGPVAPVVTGGPPAPPPPAPPPMAPPMPMGLLATPAKRLVITKKGGAGAAPGEESAAEKAAAKQAKMMAELQAKLLRRQQMAIDFD